ncbi:MAG: class I SAM-dependent methyltransferase [Magnetococcales bacterium]|nr:class I SAM-dependent methyltransferase [Magnetococcales bacterium]
MPKLHYKRDSCRLCGGGTLKMALSLTPSPPANAFVKESELEKEQPLYPLDLYFCEECKHLQLLDVVDPSLLFENYVYVSGTSQSFVDHFKRYIDSVIGKYPIPENSLVVDIGSNDGTMLSFFKNYGFSVLGIDPARDIAHKATQSGIETWNSFFSPDLAQDIIRQKGLAHIVTANNVFAHVDDMLGFVQGVKQMLHADGVFVFEVSYLLDVLQKTLFDTIYHEHLAYHSVKPLLSFMQLAGLMVIDVERTTPHGGSLRVTVQHRAGPYKQEQSVIDAVINEEKVGLDKLTTFLAYGSQIQAIKERLQELLQTLKQQGKRIAGYGAPAKATTLMYHFGLGSEHIDFIIDDSPLKQGLYSPGLHIPVLQPEAIEHESPDYLLILAWNFAPQIMEKQHSFHKHGGRFIIPIPKVCII